MIGVKTVFARSSKAKFVENIVTPEFTAGNSAEIRIIRNFFAIVAMNPNAKGTKNPERFMDLLKRPDKYPMQVLRNA